ncbi:hypothetical protein I302_108712 [Kwoniella bestiolae CBS 10118]|uniref:SET domain-containing protein n=1 Tax=Kwoniella bestiolae CBS 10118 TaxID=1296100 RepID=A0A1B9FTV5_9TREE|nr:hypothetical protein I302_07849 [Kwoniella bestiolae CBS 10118]OCF22204.1 hypothetical protein I302_07849 [Kwoniella bestiolae CBS 10118]
MPNHQGSYVPRSYVPRSAIGPFALCSISSANRNTSLPIPNVTSSKLNHTRYRMRQSQSQGNGLYSTIDIKKGKLILKESPFLLLNLDKDGYNPPKSQYHRAFHALSPKYQAIFWGLHQRRDNGETSQTMNVINTNSIPLPDEGDGVVRSVGLFEMLLRVNHCCTPHAGWYWYEEDTEMRLYAYTDIPPNTQITVSYLSNNDLIKPSVSRRKKIFDDFGFDCQCESCSLPSDSILASDERLKECVRIRSKVLRTSITAYAREKDQALQELKRSIIFLRKEKKFNALGRIYEKMYEVYAIHGDIEKSKRWARIAFHQFKKTIGRKKAMESFLVDQMDDPRRYPLWGELAKKKKSVKRKYVEYQYQDIGHEEDDEDEDDYEDHSRLKWSKSREWDEQSWDGSD